MKTGSRYGLIIIALSVTVAVLVRNCNAAPMVSVLGDAEEVPNSNTTHSGNGTSSLDDDYYSGEDDYEYKDENGLPSVNLTVPAETPTTSSTTSTTMQTSTTTTHDIETNLLGFEDTHETLPQPCPLACHCDMGLVNCSGLLLTQLPDDLPKNLVSLDLSGNLLQELDLNALASFKDLQELNVSHNEIHHIEKLSTVDSLPRLTSINLAVNKLTGVIDPDTFAGLPSLRRLTLDNNTLSLPEQSMFNLPSLEKLSLRNCSLEELSTKMFSNLSALKALDLSENPAFKTELDTNTFEPLTSIKKLLLGVMQEEQVLELCTMLTTIDVIHYPDYNISCFEYVSGYTFEESIVSNTPQPELQDPYVPPVEEMGEEEEHGNDVGLKSLPEPPKDEQEVHESVPEKEQEQVKPREMDITTAKTTLATDASNIEKQTSEVKQDMMNQILLVIILLAFIGLVIGIIFRRDYCGIKTKCCKTRRPSQTDQVTPAPEEVPLNKITTVNGNGNGNGLINGTD